MIPAYLFFFYVLLGTSLVFILECSRIKMKDKYENVLFYFCLGAAISFSVTLLALLVGHLANPNAWVPQEIPILVSNVIFDGLTLVATLLILERAIGPKKLFSIPIAIIIDVLISAIFASASLWCGLKFTEHPIALQETLNILVAHSLDGSHWEIGPYFWAMHTTFIPTMIYLSIIFLCWLAKLIYKPINWFFYRGKESNPFGLTAALFGLLAVFFMVLSHSAGHIEDWAKLKEEKQKGVKSIESTATQPAKQPSTLPYR